MLTIYTNEYRTLFVELDGELIAQAVTGNRKRYLSAFLRDGHAEAPSFTEKKIKARGADFVASSLAAVGLDIAPGTPVHWVDHYGRHEDLGTVTAHAEA